MADGGCLCGAVRYTIAGPLRPVVYCHCEQCRRTSGHHVAATACRATDLTLVVADGLRWYRSSTKAERGFCERCGSNLFWRPAQGDYLSIMAGTLDVPTGLNAEAHIFVGSKSDYYSLQDELPQHVAGGPMDAGNQVI